MSVNSAQFVSKWFIVSASLQLTQKGWGSPFKRQQWVKYEWPIRSLAHIEPSRLVMPFGVWYSFNFGNILFNLLFIFDSNSQSFCHSSCNKLLILFPKSEATIVFEASFSEKKKKKRLTKNDLFSWMFNHSIWAHESEIYWRPATPIISPAVPVLTLKVLVTTIDAQWEGMGDVGSARYELALLPPCPTIRVLSYSN